MVVPVNDGSQKFSSAIEKENPLTVEPRAGCELGSLAFQTSQRWPVDADDRMSKGAKISSSFFVSKRSSGTTNRAATVVEIFALQARRRKIAGQSFESRLTRKIIEAFWNAPSGADTTGMSLRAEFLNFQISRMLPTFRSFAAQWTFLARDIPATGLRLFLAACLAFGIVALTQLVEGQNRNRVDRGIATWVHNRPALRGVWSQRITKLGDGGMLQKEAIAGVLILFFLRKWNYVGALLIGIFGEIWVVARLQNLFHRVRPDFDDVIKIPSPGFPSGHASGACVYWGFWICFLLCEYPKKRLAKAIIAFLVLAIASVGISRVLLLNHWPTDVLAGYSFGIVWLLACFWVNQKMVCISPMMDRVKE